jgi:hypothetical protein
MGKLVDVFIDIKCDVHHTTDEGDITDTDEE